MANWLDRAKREIARGADRTTAKADEVDATAVMAVPRADEITLSSVSIGNNGGAPVTVSEKFEASSSTWWGVRYPDREPVEVGCWPPATQAGVLACQPGAVEANAFEPALRAPTSPLTTWEEKAILDWLEEIEETDPAIIGDLVNQCRTDENARAYFIQQADEGARPAVLDNDLRRCERCANLTGRGLCLAARRGEIVPSRNYEPIRDLPRRCDGYAPGLDDPDRRSGRERWPGLTPLEMPKRTIETDEAGGGAP
jgi:hypothetical protein